MADRIVIVGTKRAGSRIPTIELMQMAGRTGRSHYGPLGIVEMVVEESEINDIEDRLNDADNLLVQSVLNEKQRIGFHLVAEISARKVKTIQEADKWYKRSFCSFCGNNIEIEDAVKRLVALEAVCASGCKLFSTSLGDITSKYYFDSEDVLMWKENFDLIFDRSLEGEDVAVAWALGSVPQEKESAYLGKYRFLLDEYKDQVSSLGLEILDGTAIAGLMWWSILGGPPVGSLKSSIKVARHDFERINNALVELNENVGKWDKSNTFDSLRIQVRYRIPNYLIPLCKLKGIGKSYAYELYNIGIENLDQIHNRSSEIQGLENEGLVKVVRELLSGN